jgi:ferrous iron transport protein B
VLVSKIKSQKSTSEKIDSLLTHKIFALPIFALIMFSIYFIAITIVGNQVIVLMESLFNWVANISKSWLETINSPYWLIDLVTSGIIGGVGSVLSFLPQLFVLFLFLTLLEDSGYMSRVAFIMDRVFRKFGLSGKSFIPMLLGTGCSVPAIMSSRTISNESERKMTVMLVPFIPCGAKLPVFALFIGAFFSPIASASVYFLGFFVVIVTGIILKKTKYFRGEVSPFILELPDYHRPNLKSVFIQVWERTKSFLIKAGTIIFLASVIIWFLSTFSWNFQITMDASSSILASIGRLISWIFIPLGFGNWESTVALMVGTVAKENIISTFGIVLNTGDSQQALMASIKLLFNNSNPAAFAFMSFVLLAAPCVAAIAATKKEMGTWKLTTFTILFQTFVAYFVGLMIFQFGTLWIQSNPFKIGLVITGIGFLVILVVAYLIKNRKQGACIGCHKQNECHSCEHNTK